MLPRTNENDSHYRPGADPGRGHRGRPGSRRRRWRRWWRIGDPAHRGRRLLSPCLRRRADRRAQARGGEPDPAGRRAPRPGGLAERHPGPALGRPRAADGRRLPARAGAGGRRGTATSTSSSTLLASTPRPGDPHIWLDPVRFDAVVERIGSALGDPAPPPSSATGCMPSTPTTARGLAHCQRHEIVTSHEAFGYLAERYGLRQVAVTGISPEAEPTPADLQRVIDTVRQSGATTIFTEPLVSRALGRHRRPRDRLKRRYPQPDRGPDAGAAGRGRGLLQPDAGEPGRAPAGARMPVVRAKGLGFAYRGRADRARGRRPRGRPRRVRRHRRPQRRRQDDADPADRRLGAADRRRARGLRRATAPRDRPGPDRLSPPARRDRP